MRLSSSVVVLLLVGKNYNLANASSKGSKGSKSKKCKGTNFPPKIEFALDPWLPAEDTTDNAQRLAIPSLTQPFYNTVLDVRSTISAKDVDLIFSTNGNWMAALMKLLDSFFSDFPAIKESYLVTTSPPISIKQMDTGLVKVGNILYREAQPHLVVAPGGVIDQLEAGSLTVGNRIPIIRTYGNVILKRKGDTSIHCFSDLQNIKPGRFASSDPAEGGSFNNYRNSVKDIVLNNPELLGVSETEAEHEANALQARLFDEEGVATIGAPMHRSVPHMIATGQADAGLFFLHLAVVAMQENPGVFEAIYIAADKTGSTDDPEVLLLGQEPLVGNRVGTFSAIKTITPTNTDQEFSRDTFLTRLQQDDFTNILTSVGLRRPDGFVPLAQTH